MHSAAFAARHSLVVTAMDHVALVRIGGEDARRGLEVVCAGPVRARDGQMQHALMLDDGGRPFADAYVMCDDEQFTLISEGPPSDALIAHVRRHTENLDVTIEDWTATHALIAADGPFAWELVSDIAGAQSIGLPYLTFFHAHGYVVYRAGKTGEFGYGFLVPAEQRASLEARIAERGRALDAVQGSVDVLDQCALENLFFNIRREGRLEASPIELQLQWRVAYNKTGVGLDALRTHRAALAANPHDARRLTMLLCDTRVDVGDSVHLQGRSIGVVATAGWSELCGKCVGLALLDARWAHPGVTALVIHTAGGLVRARSVSGPLFNNRSLFVNPQLDSYARKDRVAAPPLVRV